MSEMSSWSLWVRGRLRTGIDLLGDDQSTLATLVVKSRWHLGDGTDQDGRLWNSVMADGGYKLATRCGARTVVRVIGDVLTVTGRKFGWTVDWADAGFASVAAEDGTVLLDVRRGSVVEGPWATLAVSDELPYPLGVALTASFALLRAESRRYGRGVNAFGGKPIM